MFRKLALAATAAVALGAAALSSTEASARWHGGWHHGGWHGGGWHRGWGGPRFYAYGGGPGYGSCWRVRRVWTPYGPRLRRVNVCY